MSESVRKHFPDDNNPDEVLEMPEPADAVAGPHAAGARPLNVLILGHAVDALPSIPGVAFTHATNHPFDVVAIVTPVDENILVQNVAGMGHPLCPVIDFSGSNLSRADFAAPAFSLTALVEGFAAVAPILDRIAAVRDFTSSPDSDAYLALGLSYTRARPLEAAWAPEHAHAIDYPLLAGLPDKRALLEHLADEQLLRRAFFHRVQQCDHCGSSRLNAEEQCPQCHSGQISQVALVHHYECATEAPQTSFIDGDRLVCPKCRKELLHFGVDYDKPGTVVRCHVCDKVTDEPDVAFICMDCHHVTPGDGISTVDWFHYHLTEDGKQALETLQLPHIHFANLLDGYEQALDKRDFLLLVGRWLQTAERYRRDFSLCRVTVRGSSALRERLGRRAAHTLFSKLINLVRETVRDTDILTSSGDMILIGAPETAPDLARAMLKRFDESVHATLSVSLDLSYDVIQGEVALSFLNTLE